MPALPRFTRRRLIIGALLLLLTVSVAGNFILYRQVRRPLFTESERPLIERTIALFAASGRTSAAAIRAQSFPIVMKLGDRTCVELRYYGQGHQGACYDRRGRLIEETESVVN